MKKSAEQSTFPELSSHIEISIERLKQADAAPDELRTALSRLETLANKALSKTETRESQRPIYDWFNRERSRITELFSSLWPHRTSAFQLACVAAPFAAANLKDPDPLVRAKRLLILAEAHLDNWRNPTPAPRTEFTISQALLRINERAHGSKLRYWKNARQLRSFVREHRQGMSD